MSSLSGYTIKSGFEKQPFSVKVHGVYALLRPLTLFEPLIGGFSAGSMALGHLPGNLVEIVTVLLGGVILAMLNGASNALNQVTDFDADSISKSYRPIPKGIVSLDEAMTVAVILYLAAVAGAFLINSSFGIIVLSLAFITIMYSLPPIRLKQRLWLGNLSLGLSRGVLGFMAGWSIFANPIANTPVLLGGLLSVFMFGANTSKDFPDIEGDRATGVRTLPVVFGVRKAALISAPFYVVPFPLALLLIYFGYLSASLWILMLLFPLGVFGAYKLIKSPTQQLTALENNQPWVIMYLILAGAYILSLIGLVVLNG